MGTRIDPIGHIQQRKEHRRARPFPKGKTGLDDGTELQGLHDRHGGGLPAGMGGQQELPRAGLDALGDHGGHGGDHPVDDHGHAVFRAAQKGPGHARDLKAPQLRQGVQGVGGLIDRQGLPHGLPLAPQARVG